VHFSQQFLVPELLSPRIFDSHLSPQFPLTKNVDTYNPEDETMRMMIPTPRLKKIQFYLQVNFLPGNVTQRLLRVMPYHTRLGPCGFPHQAPKSTRGFVRIYPRLPPIYFFRPPNSRQQRATRIPDFVQLVYKLREYTNKILRQTMQQARHAFASYPEVDTLGVIAASGDCWKYVEYQRENMRTSPSRSEREDPTFTLSSPPVDTFKEDSPLDNFFGAKGYVRLQEVESDNALKAIRERINHLCGTKLW